MTTTDDVGCHLKKMRIGNDVIKYPDSNGPLLSLGGRYKTYMPKKWVKNLQNLLKLANRNAHTFK